MDESPAIVITDLVDSTSLNTRLGDAQMKALWDLHDRDSRRLLRQWNGQEIDRSDGVLAMFARAGDAASFLADYHRMLGGLHAMTRARAGLHVGALDLRHNAASDVALGAKPVELVGIAKAVCARLMALALPGQTLASVAAAQALASARVDCRSHGHWRLKGLDEPVELFEVAHEGAPRMPPADHEKAYRVVRVKGQWVGLRDVPRRLPAEVGSFFGRADDLLALAGPAGPTQRLVTVLGAAGIGKSRLALRHAWGWLGDYPGGAYFCDLSAARRADDIAASVARALGVPLGAEPLQQIADVVAARGKCLLVLDNFEQVADFAATTVGRWLDAAPDARFLVTSRQTLGLASERVAAIGPLEREAATALFHERARSAHAAYVPPVHSGVVHSLVDLLDCLPLAIELAAARIAVAPPERLLQLMDDRFKLLASRGGRPDRQATLRGALEWSWDLLSGAERCGLAQLSVFEGSFAFESAASVLDLAPVADSPWVVDLLQQLADKSLLRPLAGGRFALLQSIREFAAGKLATPGQFPGAGPAMAFDTAQRHRLHYAGLQESDVLRGGWQEVDNLIAASRSATAHRDTRCAVACLCLAWPALRLAGPFPTAIELARHVQSLALSPAERAAAMWVQGAAEYACGHTDAARTSILRGLDSAPDDTEPKLLARLHCCLGEICSVQGVTSEATEHLAQAWECAQRGADVSTQCQVLNAQGALAADESRLPDAQSLYTQALALAQAAGDRRWQAGVQGNLGVLLMSAGRYDDALKANAEALDHALASNDLRWAGNAHCNLGLIHFEQDELAQAEHHLSEALEVARRLGHRALEFTTLCNLGLVWEKRGDLTQACTLHRAAVSGAERLGDVRIEAQLRSCLGSALARTGLHEEARACLQKARQILAPTNDKVSLGLVWCSVAENELLARRDADARLAVQECGSLLAESGSDEQSELGRRVAQVRRLSRLFN